MITVKDILDIKGKDIWSIRSQATAYEALQILADKNIGALLVIDDGRVVGVFSERDYARKVILKGKASKDTLVSELMTRKVLIAHPESTLDECMEIMTYHRVRHLPVFDDDKLDGVISIGDVVKQIISQQETTIKSLENYIYAR